MTRGRSAPATAAATTPPARSRFGGGDTGSHAFFHLGLPASVVLVTACAFAGVLQNGFVNWDDPEVFVRNEHLRSPGVLGWAFSTSHMEHYQPFSWLAWASVGRGFGLIPVACHALSIAGHIATALLVYLLVVQIGKAAKLDPWFRMWAPLLSALLFSVHPLRVEAVAWASAFPYILAAFLLLLSAIAYLRAARASASTVWWIAASIAAYGSSLLARPVGVGFPFVLLAMDVYPLARFDERRPARARIAGALLEKAPYVLLAAGGLVAESLARPLTTLTETGIGARLTLVARNGWLYVIRTLVPVHLSPLDTLQISPVTSWPIIAAGSAAVASMSAVAWVNRRRRPWIAAGWISWLALLAPAAGLTPSGLQASADRYTYLPGIVVSIFAATAMTRLIAMPGWRTAAVVGSVATILGLGVTTYRQTEWWRDSTTLWTRVIDLDPRSDVALYNLATALGASGRDEEAVARYEEVLRLVPEHAPARRNLSLLQAVRLERDADRLAQSRRLAEAVDRYTQALALDPSRAHSQAGRGMARVQMGRTREAIADLDAAIRSGMTDPQLPNALGLALVDSGEAAGARDVLTWALARHPGDVNLAHNLARLLATAEDPSVRDGPKAVELALKVNETTGDADPRVLDTLAAAYASAGRRDLASATATRAAALAAAQGDMEMAAQIKTRGRRYSGRGSR